MSKQESRQALRELMAANLSQQIFQYQSLIARIKPETKSLDVVIKTPREFEQFALSSECLFELDSLFHWLTQHVEVKVLSLSFETDYQSFYPEQLGKMNKGQIKKILTKLRQLSQNMVQLPQTVVFNVKRGLEGPFAELALAADIRISHRDCEMSFNHLTLGITPMSLGIELLSLVTSHAKARDWILSGRNIQAYELAHSGLIGLFIDGPEDMLALIKKIGQTSCVARIQTKQALYNNIKHLFATSNGSLEAKSLESGDFEEALKSRQEQRQAEFINPNRFKEKAKKSSRSYSATL